MRAVVVLVMVASCASSPLYSRASERLGVFGKHLHLEDTDRIGDSDIYVFCRSERGGLWAPRTYDGACVVFVCPAGDDGKRCTES